MKITKERKIRPKFLATILILLGLLFVVGGFYTIGLWFPMFFASVPLLITSSGNLIGVIPVRIIQFSFFIILVCGLVVHFIFGLYAAIGWYIFSFFLSISFKIVRIILGAMGFVAPLPNA